MPTIPILPSDHGWLLRRPLDQVVHVLTFLAVEEAEDPSRTTGASAISDDMDVAAWHEEVTGAGFDEAHWRAEVLDLARVRRGGNQQGIAAGRGRAINIGQEVHAVAHWRRHILVADHPILRLREVAVVAARCLGSIQLPLALLDAGCGFAHFSAPD
jgi:hypothetical protein